VLFVAAYQHKHLVFDAAGGIGRKLGTPPRLVGVDRLDEPDAAHGNQIVGFRRAVVFFDDVRDQAHIVTHECILGIFVAFAREAQVLRLVLGRERFGKRTFSADGGSEKDQLA